MFHFAGGENKRIKSLSKIGTQLSRIFTFFSDNINFLCFRNKNIVSKIYLRKPNSH